MATKDSITIFVHEFDGSQIRMTGDGRFSVYDVLVAFLPPTDRANRKGSGINPRQIYKSITQQYPEVVTEMDNFPFPGQGQRPTPVTDEEGMYQILMLCPGKRGPEFRGWAARAIREKKSPPGSRALKPGTSLRIP